MHDTSMYGAVDGAAVDAPKKRMSLVQRFGKMFEPTVVGLCGGGLRGADAAGDRSGAARRPHDRWMVAGTALLAVLFVSVLFSNFLESTLFFPDMFLGQLIVLLVIAHTAWQLPDDSAPVRPVVPGTLVMRGGPERGKGVFTSRR